MLVVMRCRVAASTDNMEGLSNPAPQVKPLQLSTDQMGQSIVS